MATIDPRIQAQIDALEAAFMQARGGGEDFRTAMPNLSPELLAFILQSQAQGDSAGNGLLRGFSDPSGAGFHQVANYSLLGNNPESQAVSNDPSRVDWSQSPIHFGVNTDTSNYLANYDQQGRFTGYEIAQDDNNWRDAIVAALMMAPAAYAAVGAAGGTAGAGGGTAAGGGAGGAGGSTASAGTASAYGAGGQMLLPTTAEMAAGMAPATVSSAMPALTNTLAASGYGAGTGAAAGNAAYSINGVGEISATPASTSQAASGLTSPTIGASSSGLADAGSMRAGEIASYQTNGSMPSSAATQGGNMTLLDQAKVAATGTTGTEGLLGSGGNMAGTGTGSTAGLNNGGLLGAGLNAFTGGNGDVLGGLLGAYLGYQQSKDKEQTQKSEPWGPMQPYLLGLAKDGAQLYADRKAEPFSPAQQTAYGNYGSTLDAIFQNAGGLLSGFQATGSGKNQFVRGKPGLLTGYGFEPTAEQWQPGLLGNFGTRK